MFQLKHNVLQLLPAKLQQLYQHLEVEFNPLHLCRNVMPILDTLELQAHCRQYVELLKGVTLVRLIKQVKDGQQCRLLCDVVCSSSSVGK